LSSMFTSFDFFHPPAIDHTATSGSLIGTHIEDGFHVDESIVQESFVFRLV
jgi:hypothetical protein